MWGGTANGTPARNALAREPLRPRDGLSGTMKWGSIMGHSDIEKPAFRGAEKRLSIRVVYETVVMVAEYDGVNFPPFSAFWEVKTKDLSASGIGFVSRQQPRTPLVVLMLGNPQANPIFTVAEVAYCAPVDSPDEGLGFRVGCALLKRLAR